MKKYLNIRMIKPLVMFLGVLSLLFANNSSNPRDDMFLFCLKQDVAPLTIQRDVDGRISIDNDQISEFFFEKGILELEEWIPQATEIDRDGDIFLNRIYRVYVPENQRNNVFHIINELEILSSVLYAEQNVKFTNEFVVKEVMNFLLKGIVYFQILKIL